MDAHGSKLCNCLANLSTLRDERCSIEVAALRRATRRGRGWDGVSRPGAVETDVHTDLDDGGQAVSEQPAGGPDSVATTARHRQHRFPGRQRAVQVRFSEEEFAAIELAADRAGLTATGYVGAVTLASAGGTAAPTPARTQQALTELMAARAQIRRLGGNVNQAVAALNSTGEAPDWLSHAVELTARAVRRVDAAAEQLMRRRV
jgi:hypothetical protein